MSGAVAGAGWRAAIRGPALMLAGFAGSTIAADSTGPDGGDAAIRVPQRFVGELIAMEPIPCLRRPGRIQHEDEETPPGGCHQDNLQFRAVYRVVLAIDPGLEDTVEFLATGWTSHYAHERHALVYLSEGDDYRMLRGGHAVPVFRTGDGDWASCDDDRDSEPLDFGGVVFGRTDGLSDYGIRAIFPPQVYRIAGEEAFCVRGRRLPALVEHLDHEFAADD